MKRLELPLYVAVIAVLSALIFFDGRKAAALEAQRPVTPKQLYQLLSTPKLKVQVVDLRPHDDDHFIDAHIPGAISMPGCAIDEQPNAYPYVLTVIVTAEGDTAAYEACGKHFAAARNLAGGMAAWSDANLPEDVGEYRPPKPSASGGCL